MGKKRDSWLKSEEGKKQLEIALHRTAAKMKKWKTSPKPDGTKPSKRERAIAFFKQYPNLE